MSEAVLKQAAVAEQVAHDVVGDHLAPAHAAEVNDNQDLASLQAGEQRLFEIPARLWYAMIACYAVFLAAMFAAVGGGYATLVLVVATGFVAMFFGTAKATLKHGPAQPRSPLDSAERRLPTLAGALREREVATQMLIVPVCVAFFGLAILTICLWVA